MDRPQHQPLRARLNGNVGHYCEKLSAGCRNCYSSRLQPRFRMPQFQDQRNADVRHVLDGDKLHEVLRRREPTKWFWCDMTDMFGGWVPFEEIAACFGTMGAAEHHTHQVLTKRIERAAEWFQWAIGQRGQINSPRSVCSQAAAPYVGRVWDFAIGDRSWPLPNVWLGTSVENRATLKRIDVLREIPAAVRFLSLEPLLEDLGELDLRGIHWVIVGGESGQRARPCDVAWIRNIVEQCRTQGVRVFVKQGGRSNACEHSRKGGCLACLPTDLQVREFPYAE